MVINPRGAAGSGKTELVRRVLAAYGWPHEGRAEPLHRQGRARPIAWRLMHPKDGRPLAVLGHYERTRGGCDTISRRDGGLEGAFQLAGELADSGHDVLLEGLMLSGDYSMSAAFARTHGLHILQLNTPADRSVRHLAARRHMGAAAWPRLLHKITAEQAAVAEACGRLRLIAHVEVLAFDAALRRAMTLLGLNRPGHGDTMGPLPVALGES